MKNSKQVTLDWVLLALATVTILTTLTLARKMVRFFYRTDNVWVLKYSTVALLCAVGCCVLYYLIFKSKVRDPKTYLYLVLIAAVYGLILFKLSRFPAERLHLLEYGIVGLLAHRAVKHYSKEPGCTILATLITLNIGLLDELVQGILPNRYYDTKDVMVNAAAGILGVLIATVVKSTRSRESEPDVSA